MVLSGWPPSRLITAIVSRQPSPSVVAARAQPKESRMIRFVVSTTDAGSRSKDCSAANSESAVKGCFSERSVCGILLHEVFHELTLAYLSVRRESGNQVLLA